MDGDDDTEIIDESLVNVPLAINKNKTNIAILQSNYYDPCDNGTCTKSSGWLIPVVCLVSLTLVFIIVAQSIYWYIRARRRKNGIDMMLQNPSMHSQRRCSISTISGFPPPRYSQIFDQQDGVSVFEEAPPDYETMQPDLVKTLTSSTETLSRGSSIASQNRRSSPRVVEFVISEIQDISDNADKAERGDKEDVSRTSSTRRLLDAEECSDNEFEKKIVGDKNTDKSRISDQAADKDFDKNEAIDKCLSSHTNTDKNCVDSSDKRTNVSDNTDKDNIDIDVVVIRPAALNVEQLESGLIDKSETHSTK